MSVLPLLHFRQAEVQDLGEALARHHDVFGLDVAVDDAGPVRAGQDETRVVRPECPREHRLDVRRQRAEPVHDVAIQHVAPRQRVRHDPLASGVDQRVGPPAARNEEQAGRRARHGGGEDDRRRATATHVTTAGRSSHRRQAPLTRISSIDSKARSSSASSV